MDQHSEDQSAQITGDGDRLLDQSAIDALLGGSGGAESASESAQTPPDTPVEGSSGGMSWEDLDALVSAAGDEVYGAEGSAHMPESLPASPNGTHDADQQTAGRSSGDAESSSLTAGPSAQSFALADFDDAVPPENEAKRVTMLSDVNLRVKIQLGKTRMLVEDVLKLGEGSVVELDKLAGDPVDVLVNDRLIARGEVLVLNDNFCVRVCEVISRDPHRVTE